MPSHWFFVSGATSVFAVNCSDVVLFSAIGGHPQVGALRSLKQLQAPRNVSMVSDFVDLVMLTWPINPTQVGGENVSGT